MSDRKLTTANLAPWAIFFIWCAVAIAAHWSPKLMDFSGPEGVLRLTLIGVWIGFLIYSWNCMKHENFVKSVKGIWGKYWGRQIIIDLYISVLLSLAVVFMVTGSIFWTIFFGLAFIPYANQAILLFLILYTNQIVALLS